jgi:protoporphyrinogen oxidase
MRTPESARNPLERITRTRISAEGEHVTRVIILGAGPAGLAAALELAERNVEVTVLERAPQVGGNAGSFELSGVRVDFGSHRLHPASDPQVLGRIRNLLGEDLLTRPRHGRIRLMGRWIHFPLQPLDLLLRVHPKFAVGVAMDLARKLLPTGASSEPETFATVLNAGLGRTICQEFYFPYARKLWGLEPGEIAPVQAYKRVSAGSIGKMLRRLLPGGTGSGAANTKGIFYYPRNGYGQISEAIGEAAVQAGAELRLDSTITAVRLHEDSAEVVVQDGDGEQVLTADQVFSTIPVTLLSKLCEPGAPPNVEQAASSLEFRSMLLVYLTLEQSQFTEFDAHYFPGEDFCFTRLSEPKNYSASSEPEGRTVLCAEVPCFQGDDLWSMDDAGLGKLIADGLADAGLPVRCEVSNVHVRRLPFIYPLYRRGYEEHFEQLDSWVSQLPRMLSFGRQGLYVHDNTHHAIFMAQAAAQCLRDDGSVDRVLWAEKRKIFEAHVVED